MRPMECPTCGQEIRPGQRRVPTPDGPVHETCLGGSSTTDSTQTRRGKGYETVLRAAVLVVLVTAFLFVAAKLAIGAVRRLFR